MTARTVVKRLDGISFEVDGRSHLYESTEVLPILYDHGRKSEESYDLTEERARLSHHQANIAALDEKVKEKTLIPADVVLRRWADVAANVRARLLSIPSQLAVAVENLPREEVEKKTRELIVNALEELKGGAEY